MLDLLKTKTQRQKRVVEGIGFLQPCEQKKKKKSEDNQTTALCKQIQLLQQQR